MFGSITCLDHLQVENLQQPAAEVSGLLHTNLIGHWTATQLRSNMGHNHNNFNRNKCQLDSQKFVGIVFESKPKLLGSNCPLQSMFIKRQNTRAETSECLPRDFQSKILRCV